MDYYEEFGLAPSATSDEIRQAHKRLALVFHPDRFRDEETRRLAESQMKRLNGIYGVLNDSQRRFEYDLALLGGSGEESSLSPNGFSQLAGFSQMIKRSTAAQRNVACALAGLAAILALYWYSTAAFGDHAREASYVREARLETVADPLESAMPASPPGRSKPAKIGVGESRVLVEENRELRRALEQSRLQRDEALSEVTRLKHHPSVLTPPPVAENQPPALSPPPEIKAVAEQASVVWDPVPPKPAAAPLAATWFYVPRVADSASKDVYPPEYIELNLAEDNGNIRGRYWARYRVADRAISPEVIFRFEGKVNSDGRYEWSGRGGSRGDVQLRLLADNTLEVSWLASELGKQLGLGSGRAVLVREHAR